MKWGGARCIKDLIQPLSLSDIAEENRLHSLWKIMSEWQQSAEPCQLFFLFFSPANGKCTYSREEWREIANIKIHYVRWGALSVAGAKEESSIHFSWTKKKIQKYTLSSSFHFVSHHIARNSSSSFSLSWIERKKCISICYGRERAQSTMNLNKNIGKAWGVRSMCLKQQHKAYLRESLGSTLPEKRLNDCSLWLSGVGKKKAEEESEAWMRWLLGKKECISLTTLLCCNPLYDSINNLSYYTNRVIFFVFHDAKLSSSSADAGFCGALEGKCWVKRSQKKNRDFILCSFNFTE